VVAVVLHLQRQMVLLEPEEAAVVVTGVLVQAVLTQLLTQVAAVAVLGLQAQMQQAALVVQA
jgi:hypothetical protein